MTDYYLRTNTEAAMANAFLAAGITISNTDGQIIDGTVIDHNGIRLDLGWIGPVTWTDPETEQTQTDARFHANLRVAGELTPAQIAALPILDPPPSHPMRVWA
jgi:hypothetical protein